jgi:hypothetical protein
MPVYVTITPVDVAQAVADEMNAVAALNPAVWTQTFTCTMTFFTPMGSEDLETLQIRAIPILRQRERGEQHATPGGSLAGRGSSRAVLQSRHVVNLEFYKTVDTTAANLDGQIKALAAFLYQVDDYFMAAHRRLATVAGSASNNVYCVGARTTNCSPEDIEKARLWRGAIQLTFQEQTKW